jgi:hypothetical protein
MILLVYLSSFFRTMLYNLLLRVVQNQRETHSASSSRLYIIGSKLIVKTGFQLRVSDVFSMTLGGGPSLIRVPVVSTMVRR